jgi:thioester reductase-like protein
MPDDVVLITGFPGLLARTVCAEIVQSNPQTHVRALGKAHLIQEASAWVETLPAGQRERVSLIEGDAAAIDLGLSGAEFKALAREVTRIHHCAQVTHLGVERRTAERLNIGATQELLELASHCDALKCLVFHSTAYVSGDRSGIVLEDELKAGQSFRNVFEETKARAEKLVRGAMSDLPIVVVRPATVVGHAQTGEIDRLDGPYLVVFLVVTSPPDLPLPLPGHDDEPLNLVPIDWVARAAVALGRDARALGRTFHLVDEQPLTARKAFELVARAGGRRTLRGSIPTNVAKALLHTPGLDRITKSPRALLETMTTSVRFDSSNARELLPRLGVGACPPFETYVEKLVEYVQQRVRRRKATRRDSALEMEDPPA